MSDRARSSGPESSTLVPCHTQPFVRGDKSPPVHPALLTPGRGGPASSSALGPSDPLTFFFCFFLELWANTGLLLRTGWFKEAMQYFSAKRIHTHTDTHLSGLSGAECPSTPSWLEDRAIHLLQLSLSLSLRAQRSFQPSPRLRPDWRK